MRNELTSIILDHLRTVIDPNMIFTYLPKVGHHEEIIINRKSFTEKKCKRDQIMLNKMTCKHDCKIDEFHASANRASHYKSSNRCMIIRCSTDMVMMDDKSSYLDYDITMDGPDSIDQITQITTSFINYNNYGN